MKKNIIIKGVACLLALGGLASCSEDYLDLKPISGTTADILSEDVKYCESAVNAIAAAMYFPVSGYAINYPCGQQGEATMMTRYGEGYGSDDFIYTMAAGDNGRTIKLQYLNNGRYVFNAIAWGFYYGMIGQANAILDVIDGTPGEEGYRNFVKAQALTFRAHCYFRLLQLYAPRWIESNNGEAISVPLRLTKSTKPMPAAKMKEVLDQMYKDLDLAVQLFQNSGSQRRMNASNPDINVCYGTYARLALLKNDWEKARDMARKAREGYTLMTADEYLAGFVEANHEWMWYGSNDVTGQDNIAYGFWGAFNACNGTYPVLWSDTPGAGAINIDLYNKMDEKDIRRQCFLTPDKLPNINIKNWYNNRVNVDNMNFYDMAKNNRMSRAAVEWAVSRTPANPSFGKLTGGYCGDDGTSTARTPVMIYGAQFKFYGTVPYGASQYPWMRAAEMWLIEAEASAMLGETSNAQTLLTELVSKRVEGYTCSLSGQALIDEVRLQRRLELWGEGYSWHDFKRWGLPLERRAWVEGDTNSGNFPNWAAGTVLPTDGNHWVFCVPSSEYEYNPLIHEADYQYNN